VEELEERMEVEKWRRRERTDMARIRVLRRRSNGGRRFSEGEDRMNRRQESVLRRV